MIVTYWPLLVSLGAVGLAFFLGVVWGRRAAAAAKVDTQRWKKIAVVSQDERNLTSDEQLLAESKKHIEELKSQLLQNQEQLIELLRAQLTKQEARVVSVEKLASDWAQVATERQRRINELEVKLVVEQGTASQLRVVNAELQKRLDQATLEAS